MQDEDKTKEQLISELHELRRRLSDSEKNKADGKRAQEELREAKQQIETILSELPVAIAVTRIEDGAFFYVNKNFEKLLGYYREELIGRTSIEMGFYCLKERMRLVRKVQEARAAHNVEFKLRCKNGVLVETYISAVPFVYQGKDSMLNIVVDVSEQKRIERHLREQDERLRVIFEISQVGIILVSPRGVITLANQRMADMFGCTLEELIGSSYPDHLHPDEIKIGDERMRKLIAGEIDSVYTERHYLRRNGSDFWGYLSGCRHEDETGNLISLVGIIADITERKRSEEALRESEDRYRSLFELESDAIFMIDNETGRILEANRAASSLYGYSRDELLARKNTDLSAEPEETQRQTRGNPIVVDYMVTIPLRIHRKKDGTEFPVEITGRFFIRNERSVHIAAIRDITERKEAEEARRRLEERLQRAEKMEALGTLAGGVAHDLNNVLGIVVGYSELLIGGLDESSSTRSEAMEILKSGQRAAAIVQDLLTLARRGIPSRKVLNLNNIVRECQQSPEYAQLLSYHPNIDIGTDFEVDLLNISGSSVHLAKSIYNLVANAAEALPNGGTITIKTRNHYLDKPVWGYDEVKEGDYAILSITDTGEGIAESDLKRIFEPFYTKKVMGRSGTGLGLAVVWGTVKDHFGYINVDSQEGQGTTFTLYFPVSRDEISPDQISISIAEYMGNGELILIVDDVKEQRGLAERMLTKLNYKVSSVSSGEEAVKHMRNNPVDLIVLDMIMGPGMDGLGTYSKIVKIHPGQKAIIVSGYAETERVTKAQELGAGAYVKKPYVLEKLGLAVKKELARSA